ncbi:MAG: cobalt transporter CbiM [Thermodesulfobacteriota bacterium]|nr:cobalt transporter CbiM [Thermodesulfobacteriota bacterium]
MHISEGILSAPVLATGIACAAVGVAIGLKKIDYNRMPKVAILSACFFVASLIHVPIGPSSVHLILNGLIGLLLGWVAFPAIMIALLLQAILFQFGGLTTLGVNTTTMALPAVICFYIFRSFVMSKDNWVSAISAFVCGFTAVALGAILVALSLIFTENAFLAPAKLILFAHLPVMVIEGIITAFCIAFLKKVKPELLEVDHDME